MLPPTATEPEPFTATVPPLLIIFVVSTTFVSIPFAEIFEFCADLSTYAFVELLTTFTPMLAAAAAAPLFVTAAAIGFTSISSVVSALTDNFPSVLMSEPFTNA